MIKSLTGFGNTTIDNESDQLSITVRAVNARFLDIKFSGIELNPELEIKIRKEIIKSLYRGSVIVQIYLKRGNDREDRISFDRNRFEQIEQVVHNIQTEFGRNLDLSKLITIDDLLISQDATELADTDLFKGISTVIKQVDEMRIAEGRSIFSDVKIRIVKTKKLLNDIEQQSTNFVEELQKKYVDKINLMLTDSKINEDRLMQEIAIIVDRSDFTEEIVRSRSHCEQLAKVIKSEDPIGKKINFILQELSREVNTIGSKSPNAVISQFVVELKCEIEKIREQAQNIL